MLIRSKVPLRISFGGGGTDVAPYKDEKGGAVLRIPPFIFYFRHRRGIEKTLFMFINQNQPDFPESYSGSIDGFIQDKSIYF